VNVVLTCDTIANDDYDINKGIDEDLPVTTLPANEEVRSNLRDISINVLAAIDKLLSSDIVLDTGGSTGIFYSKLCLTNIYDGDTETILVILETKLSLFRHHWLELVYSVKYTTHQGVLPT